MSAVAVIVAAGKGDRFGDSGKVLVPIAGKPCLSWTLDAFERAELVDAIVIVVGDHTQEGVQALLDSGSWSTPITLVSGGASRQISMANGVKAVPDDTEVILVHDAARPLTTPVAIDACVRVAREQGAAILAAPVTDTIKRVEADNVVETVDRSSLWAAQTPQVFRSDWMRQIADHALAGDIAFTDEASLAESLGFPVQIVASDSTNLKITHPHDIAFAEAILRNREKSS